MKLTHEQDSWEITPIVWKHAAENEISRRIYQILLHWIPFANQEFEEWDGRPNTGYFFGGNFWYSSESSSTALVFAALAKLGSYDEHLTGIPRNELKIKAIKAIRYMGFTHDTGPEDCVRVKGPNRYTSEKKWGGKGDNFFMASQNGRSIASLATAAWLLWDDLDEETKQLVQNIVADYADRFCGQSPRSGSYYDTQCEENAWTSAGLATAIALFPNHTNASRWKEGFSNWAINTVTTYWDRLSSRSGLIDGLTSQDIQTINFHPDYTTENHAFVHPSYIAAGINLRAIHAVFSVMSGQEVHPSATYNNEKLYEKTIKRWTQFDGLAVPVQGQDWWYNRQHERQFTHAVLNVVHGNRDAARLERNCLSSIEGIQNSNPNGCLLEKEVYEFNPAHAQSSKDFEPGSALDLVNSYLLHVFGGEGVKPVESNELAGRLSGVYHYPHGSFIVHRTTDTFTSFSWRNNVTLFNLPKQGIWNVTPLFNSYTGTVKFAESKETNKLTNEEVIRGVDQYRLNELTNGFGVTVTVLRGDEEIAQHLGVVSLPNGQSLYTEMFKKLQDCKVKDAYTGIIGVRNEYYEAMPELAPGKRALHFPGVSYSFNGFIGKEPNQEVTWQAPPYLNLDSKVGFILNGSHGVKYVNRHQYEKWKGIEDLLILNDIGGETFLNRSTLKPFTVLTMPNQTMDETKAANRHTKFLSSQNEDVQLLTTGTYLVYTNFNDSTRWVSGKTGVSRKDGIDLFDGINTIKNGEWNWQGKLNGRESGFLESLWRIDLEHSEPAYLDIQIHQGYLTVHNLSREPVSLKLMNRKTNAIQMIEIDSSSCFSISGSSE